MTAKRKFQIATDMLMIVMLPFLMAYQLIGEAIHEWIGMGMFLLFLCHHLLNRNWHKNLLKGKPDTFDIWGAVGLIRDDERRDKLSGKYQRSKADLATLPP